ncbi:MAG: Holliday junction branch migration DNA helicase RuvB [bacterium]
MTPKPKKDQDDILNPKLQKKEESLDKSLRPKDFKSFIGQKKIKENMKIMLEAARKRKDVIEHVLLYGPAGIGKTTLASVIANEIGTSFRITSGPAIERAGDLASILTNLKDNDILFIDEIHRINRNVEEILYPCMEDYALDIIVGKGPSAKSLRLNLPKFTLIGATTRIGLLSGPLRDRFGVVHRLDFYEDEEIGEIITQSAKKLGFDINQDSATQIATSSRKTPRVANRLLKRIRDYADVKKAGKINPKTVQEALEMLDVDRIGLDRFDRTLLTTIIEKFKGGPVGLGTMAAATSEDSGTIEEVIEPYLMRIGFLKRTSRGRVVTPGGYEYLGYEFSTEMPSSMVKKLKEDEKQEKLW